MASSSSRTAVITGATRGLGLHTAETIARTPGWRVVLAVRDLEQGRTVAERLGGEAVALDLASLASVRTGAAELADRHAPLHALVLNAGLQVPRADQVTQDGFELTFGVNHLGHFLLLELLRGALAPGARVAVVASGTHFGTWGKSGPYPAPRWRSPRELARADGGSGQVAYSTSKLANVLFASEAARRLGPAVRVNAFDPGLMPATGLARAYPRPLQALYGALAPLLVRLIPWAGDAQDSGTNLARLVTDPALEDVTGRYFEGREVAQPSSAAQDAARADELWTESESLVGLERSPA